MAEEVGAAAAAASEAADVAGRGGRAAGIALRGGDLFATARAEDARLATAGVEIVAFGRQDAAQHDRGAVEQRQRRRRPGNQMREPRADVPRNVEELRNGKVAALRRCFW